MPVQEMTIDPTFEGPPGAAHGGYACGRLAAHLGGDPEITLWRPVPVGTAIRLTQSPETIELHDGNVLLAAGTPTKLDEPEVAPPTFGEALAATASFPGLWGHPFPRCVGCGTRRTDAAALRIFPGPLGRRPLVAAVWYPGVGALTGGFVRPEYAWAALDCPGGWAAILLGHVDRPAVLGRMAARVEPAIPAQNAYIVVGWLDGVSGRKLTAGTALFTRDGAVLGFSRQTWLTRPDEVAR
jgi:hypothetical protein